MVVLLSTRLGRRGALMALCAPSVAGWMVMATARPTGVAAMYAGRVLQGAGGFSAVMQVRKDNSALHIEYRYSR